MTLRICGDSHVRALRAGLEQIAARTPCAQEITVFPLGTADKASRPFSKIEDGRVVLTNKRFRAKLEAHFGVSSFDPEARWGICLGAHNARIYQHPGWQTAAPSWLGLRDMQPVSAALFAEIVARDQAHIRGFITQLLDTGIRPFVIFAPWPRRTNPAIAKTGIRPEIVQAIDREARALYAGWLAERGLDIVTPPPETADEDGFLRPEYAQGRNDPHHGNVAYGKLMMQRIIDAQGQGPAADARHRRSAG